METEGPHSSNPGVGTSINKEKGKESQSNERSKERKVQHFFSSKGKPGSQPSIRRAIATKESTMFKKSRMGRA